MFTWIIDNLDSQVKTPVFTTPLPADAATAVCDDDDLYDGIGCHDDGAEQPWCSACQAKRQRRDEEFANRLSQAARMVSADAVFNCDDDHDDFPPMRSGWTPEHARTMARNWRKEATNA